MSYEKKQTYMGENKTILEVAGELFQTIPIKVLKTDISSTLVNGIYKSGTIVDKLGKPAAITGTEPNKVSNAFGILYRDINFTNSNGKETIPILIFGFVDEKTLPTTPEPEHKVALKMIQFL